MDVALVGPDAAAFGAEVCPSAPRSRCARRLHERLGAIDPAATALERERALVRLAAWIRRGPRPPEVRKGEPPQVARTRLLVAALRAFEPLRARLARLVAVILVEESADAFFAKAGIPGDRGLFAETVDRLARRVLPQPIDEEDLTHLVALLFPDHADVAWLRALPIELVEELLALLSRADGAGPRGAMPSLAELPLGAHPSLPDAGRASLLPSEGYGAFTPLRAALLDAVLILASRISSAGLSDQIRARSPAVKLRDSPFFRLPRTIDALLATPRRELAEVAAFAAEVRAAMDECRGAVKAVYERLEATGVSVDVVYRLELVERSLDRVGLLVDLLVPRSPHDRLERSVRLLITLLDERRRDLSMGDVLRTMTRLLSRKVIERAGETGEKYITATPLEWLKMLASALGGGVCTAFTGGIKILIGKLHRPLLQEGLLTSANYAGTFLFMQLLGFTLATKQPSNTAAALAGAVRDETTDPGALATTMARLSRSQFAAVLGNLATVTTVAWGIDRAIVRWRGDHLVTPEYADKIMAGLHPLESGTIPYACMTGIILWLSSLAGGWLENWAVFRRIPEAIEEHRLREWIGQRPLRWAGRFFAHNVGGFGANVAVGLMLGMTATIGQIVGVPLDVRHVTIAAGHLVYAASAKGPEVLATPAFHAAVQGVGVVLSLNLVVSFTLAAIVAFRARGVSTWQTLRLGLALIVGFARSPLRFFLPVERGSTGKG